MLTGERPYPSFDDALANPALGPRLVEVAASFGWTRGAITQAGWYPWLAALGAELRCVLPDGTRMLGVHAFPSSDDGPGIDTRTPDDALAALLHGCDADMVIGGHTHDMTDRWVAGIRAVNGGSVSNPSQPDRCATYVVMHIEPDTHELEHRVFDYDHAAVVRAIDDARHPSADYLKRFHGPG